MATTRRMILLGGLGAAGALVVGCSLWPSDRVERANKLAANAGENFVNNWIKIAQDDTVTIVIPHCDMGTGIFTALAQMAAEELDADWSKVRAEQAPTDPVFANGAVLEGFVLNGSQPPALLKGLVANSFRYTSANVSIPGLGYAPQITGGSSAVRGTGVYGLRIAGAAARELLVKAAAARWKVAPSSCTTKSNRVLHAASGRSFGYGELAAAAAQYTPSGNPQLKAKSEYTLVGKPLPRLDLPQTVDGTAKYGIDVQLPGMMYAAILISPVFGGRLTYVAADEVAKMRGVKKVLQLADAAIVVADRFWRARNGIAALNPVFDKAGHGSVTTASIAAGRAAALTGELSSDLKKGTGTAALSQGRLVEATYHVPYLAHAAMEPLNATALYQDGKLEVWAGTQDGLGSRAHCAQVAGLPLEKVTLHLLRMGGSFGRRLPGLWNYLDYAVKTAMAMAGTPVKLIFSREQDMQHDFYRPDVVSRFRAALDAKGLPLAWANDYVGDDGPSPEAHIVYGIANQEVRAAKLSTHVPTGPWRSVAASWHGFFIESFVDELAHAAKLDPVAYRLALLADSPRHQAVVKAAADAAQWDKPLPPGRGRGIALFESFATIVAHVVEVTVAGDGGVKVERVVSAVDCGYPVNPDGLKAQIEGGILYGLTAALYGEITIDQGAVVQANFSNYEMVRLAQCPQIEIKFVDSNGPLGGAGEPGLPPIAPALTNAIYAATGVRIRDLPVRNTSLASGERKAAAL